MSALREILEEEFYGFVEPGLNEERINEIFEEAEKKIRALYEEEGRYCGICYRPSIWKAGYGWWCPDHELNSILATPTAIKETLSNMGEK